MDLVAQSTATEADADSAAANGATDGRPSKRQRIYADHWPLSAIEAGIRRGALHQVGRSQCMAPDNEALWVCEHSSYNKIEQRRDPRHHADCIVHRAVLRLQGTLKVSRYNAFEGFVASESVGQDILISGRVDMNR